MPTIKKKDESMYEVESHNKGEFYTIDIDAKTCTCPHYQFRMKRFGGECKHLAAVRDFIAANSEVKEYKSKYKAKKTENGGKGNRKQDVSKKEDNDEDKEEDTKNDKNRANSRSNDLTAEILKEVAGEEGKDAVELIDKYGEIMINDLIAKGYLIESKGKVKILK
ncbi:SWIM zinc finger family protein [Candidatus Woesearchaeota archaeon]|nr:SWIM zinc finger family protein [Candidatus Woesearchaeota archaeon]